MPNRESALEKCVDSITLPKAQARIDVDANFSRESLPQDWIGRRAVGCDRCLAVGSDCKSDSSESMRGKDFRGRAENLVQTLTPVATSAADNHPPRPCPLGQCCRIRCPATMMRRKQNVHTPLRPRITQKILQASRFQVSRQQDPATGIQHFQDDAIRIV